MGKSILKNRGNIKLTYAFGKSLVRCLEDIDEDLRDLKETDNWNKSIAIRNKIEPFESIWCYLAFS